MGGKNLDLLVLEGIPKRRAGRYSEKVQSCSDFELLISNLSESDLNHNYCCTVGFSECRLKLSLKEGNFECKFIYILVHNLGQIIIFKPPVATVVNTMYITPVLFYCILPCIFEFTSFI